MQATLELSSLIENCEPQLEQSDVAGTIQPRDRLQTLEPVQLAYVGGGTGLASFF
jgi:hypothetical protein